jgi:sugar/nucleoside kinase (ribokinase family)
VGAAFLDWVRLADLVLANSDEAAVLAGDTDPVAQARTLATVAVHAVVKRGPAGAVWAGPDGVFEAPGRAATVADSTGAGDAFAAGLLAAWVGGAAPAAALQRAVVLGTEAVGRLGARPTG